MPTRDDLRDELRRLLPPALLERTVLAIEAWRASKRDGDGPASNAAYTEMQLCLAECDRSERPDGLSREAIDEANRRRDQRRRGNAAAEARLSDGSKKREEPKQ